MIKIEHIDIQGWEPAIRGMRNPMNSWKKCDSGWQRSLPSIRVGDIFHGGEVVHRCVGGESVFTIGPNDKDLMLRLAKAGSEHSKYRRMITVWMDITAPLYWWKEFDTYKVGTVANSCSTMHKIHAKEFELNDFSHDHLIDVHYMEFDSVEEAISAGVYCAQIVINPYGLTDLDEDIKVRDSANMLEDIIFCLNAYRDKYLETKDKKYWWQLIQLLPSSYNQKRTVMLNYEALAHIYKQRKDHKLDEWRAFCKMIRNLPYSEIITLEEGKDE